MHLVYWLNSEAETLLRIFSIDLLGVRSWHHPVVTSRCIFGLPGNAILSVNANAVGHYHVLFKSAFHMCFLLSKPCFSLKSVSLNSCYTKANQKWIDSFPETSFSSIHPHHYRNVPIQKHRPWKVSALNYLWQNQKQSSRIFHF